MAIDPARLELVRDSFRRIRGNLQPPSAMFYDALFQHAPGLRGLFRDDLEGQGMRFMTTLAVIVDDLDRPEVLEPQLAAIGRSHAALGVRPAHFAPMEEALIDTLRAQLGEGRVARRLRRGLAAHPRGGGHRLSGGGGQSPQPADCISRRRLAVRSNSNDPEPSRYSFSGSSAAVAISFTFAS
jgi:nitric oxide dioxygenase